MSDAIDGSVATMDESIQLPRRNGELVFESPWEARAFGIAVALNENGNYPWKDFSAALATEIQRAEGAQEDSVYYERWLRALQKIAVEKGLVSEREIRQKTEETAEAEDHQHDH